MSIREILLRLLKDLGSAFMPFTCHRCQASTDFGVVFCSDCNKKLISALHTPQLVKDTLCDFPVYTLSSYSSLTSDVIRIIKYRPSAKLLKVLVQTCCQHGNLKSLLKKDDIIVPVPMHTERFCSRGFNQADVLAGNFAKAAGSRLSPALQRVRATRPQADCSEEERRDNLKGAFRLEETVKTNDFKNRRIVLVDDVATTGSTLQLCANKLKELKPAEICALVVSHSYKQKTSTDKQSG